MHNWNLRLVGLDARHHVGLQVEFNGKESLKLSSKSLALKSPQLFPQVVAVVAYDEPTEQVQQYALYALTVSGVVQPGGAPAS